MENLDDLMNDALGNAVWQRIKKGTTTKELDAKTLFKVARLLQNLAEFIEILAFTVSAAERVNCERK